MLGRYHIFDTHWIEFSQNRLQKVLVLTFSFLKKTYTLDWGINIFLKKNQLILINLKNIDYHLVIFTN
jgi:hypothetical protein